jgi:methylglyoxal synthase
MDPMSDAPPERIPMPRRKRIALVAHDHKKQELLEWVRFNRLELSHHQLCASGTTARLLHDQLGLQATALHSGPLGGDQQVGAAIAEQRIDLLIFFWDPLAPQPHDSDVKALLRIAVVWNVPVACNRSSADFMLTSPLMHTDYERRVPDYSTHRERSIPGV